MEGFPDCLLAAICCNLLHPSPLAVPSPTSFYFPFDNGGFLIYRVTYEDDEAWRRFLPRHPRSLYPVQSPYHTQDAADASSFLDSRGRWRSVGRRLQGGCPQLFPQLDQHALGRARRTRRRQARYRRQSSALQILPVRRQRSATVDKHHCDSIRKSPPRLHCQDFGPCCRDRRSTRRLPPGPTYAYRRRHPRRTRRRGRGT